MSIITAISSNNETGPSPNATPPNAPDPRVPKPPEDVCQDDGKFYKAYDAIAEEVDEDMTKSLKEQLDGMLVFAGLFAGVNSAFLALTLPLMSADPADDTNALLALNNALLMQQVSGRNDSAALDSTLPSKSFAPSGVVLSVNSLFALSLSFAIVSSFLAVLGRQWLVYYRKRSGGGPDRQRWEQLKRFLGAERWGLELILDDILPSLLQIGLIIFCISLVIYLNSLNSTLSLIVGVPLSLALAVFIWTAICTIWDRFCPFHSPLSHLLNWAYASRSYTSSRAQMGKEEKSLQITALQRTICTSDDPSPLLHAAANILAISDSERLEALWSDGKFRDRFIEMRDDSYTAVNQLRGRHQFDSVASAMRLYWCAATHILIHTKIPGTDAHKYFQTFGIIDGTDSSLFVIPGNGLAHCTPVMIRASVVCLALSTFGYPSEKDKMKIFYNHLANYCTEVNGRDLGLLSLTFWSISQFREERMRLRLSIPGLDNVRKAYNGDEKAVLFYLDLALDAISDQKSGHKLNDYSIMTSMLRCVEHVLTYDGREIKSMTLEKRFTVLGHCEAALRVVMPQEDSMETIRRIRMHMKSAIEKLLPGPDKQSVTIPQDVLDGLDTYFEILLNAPKQKENPLHDGGLHILDTFAPILRHLRSYSPRSWEGGSGDRWGDVTGDLWKKRDAACETFNNYVSTVDEVFCQMHHNVRLLRDPEACGCHFGDEPPPACIAATYSLLPDEGLNT